MNTKLKELICISNEKATAKDDELLVNELKNAQLIMPVNILSDDPLEFEPVKIANPRNQEFIALFTDDDELIKSDVEFSVVNIETSNLAEMINDGDYFGVAINPFSEYSLAIPLDDFLKLF